MSNYCHCGSSTKFSDMTRSPAPAGWSAQEVWVCSLCHKISHAVTEVVVPVRGPKGAILRSAKTDLLGITTLRWSNDTETIEFKPYPRSDRMAETQTEPLLFSLWRHLDHKVEELMADPTDQQRKYEARGVAETLSILMTRFYPTADDVVREAVSRYKHKQNGVDHESPGLGEFLWNPLYNADGSPRTFTPAPVPVKAAPAARPKAKKSALSEGTITGIKSFLEAGLGSADVAKMFNVSVADVDALR